MFISKITHEDVINVLNNNLPHLHELRHIILNNNYEEDFSYEYIPFVSPNRQPYIESVVSTFKLGSKVASVLFTNHTTGYKALFYLLSNPNLTIHLMSSSDSPISKQSFEYLLSQFPNRVFMFDLETASQKETKPTFNVIHTHLTETSELHQLYQFMNNYIVYPNQTTFERELATSLVVPADTNYYLGRVNHVLNREFNINGETVSFQAHNKFTTPSSNGTYEYINLTTLILSYEDYRKYMVVFSNDTIFTIAMFE